MNFFDEDKIYLLDKLNIVHENYSSTNHLHIIVLIKSYLVTRTRSTNLYTFMKVSENNSVYFVHFYIFAKNALFSEQSYEKHSTL